MADNCINPTPTRRKFGFSNNFLKSIRQNIDDFEPTQSQLKALAVNLGVDDLRNVELRKGKKHLFGRNLADIEEWKGGDIPKDTIVKKVTNDGEHQYFLANRKTETPPSKWIIDGKKTKPNPDWAYIGKNVTTDDAGRLKTFKRLGTGVYKEDPEGDIFLNVTKPYKGDDSPSIYELANQGYDAIDRGDGVYKLFDEATQAKRREQVFTRPESKAMSDVSTKVSKEDIKGEDVGQRLRDLGFGSQVAGSLGGYVAGSIVDNWAETENSSWIGGALGLALGSPKARAYLKDTFNFNANSFEDVGKTFQDLGEEVQRAKEAVVDGGYRGDPSDTEKVNTFYDRFYEGYKRVKKLGGDAWKTIMRSSYLQSGFTDLMDMGVQTAKKYYRILQGVESAATRFMDMHGETLSKYYGRDITLNKWNQHQVDVMRSYIDNLSPELRREFGDVSDDYLKEQFGAAVHRIITHEAEIDGGTFRFNNDSYAARQVYKNEQNRKIDRFILQSDEGKRLVDSFRETTEKWGQEALRVYKESFDNIVETNMTPQQKRILYDMRDNSLGVKQWRKKATDKQYEVYQNAVKGTDGGEPNDTFLEAIELHERMNKIENMEGRYFPQIWSFQKENLAKNQWLNSATVEVDGQKVPVKDLSKDKQQELWAEQKLGQILEGNRDGFTLQEVTESGDNLETVVDRNYGRLLNDLKNNYVQKISNPEIRRQVIRDLNSGDPDIVDQYIKTKLDDKGKPLHYVTQPDRIPYPIIRDINKGELSKAERTFFNYVALKQSNQLDNPRNYILPTNMIETNLEKVVRHYSHDVAPKLHLTENGIGTQRGLNKMIGDIKAELNEKGIADNTPEMANAVEKIRSWYANINRTSDRIEIDMDSDRRIARYNKKLRNRKLIDTAMNFGYMPFLWATTFYSLFQPFITGPFMAKYRNIGKSYKQFFKNPEQFKNLTNELEKMGVIQRKVSSFAAEMQGKYRTDELEGTQNSFVDSMYNISQKGVTLSSRFSLVKPVLSKMGRDIEDLGLLRFVAGDMMDISGAESALTTMTVMRELEDLTEAGELILKAPDDISGRVSGEQIKRAIEERGGEYTYRSPTSNIELELNGKRYRWGDIKRRIELLGVENVEAFVEQSRKVNDSVGESNISTWNKKLVGEVDSNFEMSPYLKKQYGMIADNIVNQLHGRSRLSRPLKWTDNPYGRLLSQFSVYSQNYAVQTTRSRIYQPIKEWLQTYNTGDENLMKVMWWMRRGDDEKLEKVFGNQWKQAYNDFPVDAFDNMFKVAPVVMGTGAVMMATRDVWMDMVNMLGSEAVGADDYEAWRQTKSRYDTVNKWFDDDKVGWDALRMMKAALFNAAEMGFGGRQAQLLINESRYTNGGVFSKTPITGRVNDAYETFTTPTRVAPEDAVSETFKAISEFTLLNSPVIGSFHDFRQSLVNSQFKKPKNRDVSFYDNETGSGLEYIELFNP